MKSRFTIIVVALLLAPIVLFGQRATRIQLGSILPANSVWDKLLKEMAVEWNEETDGRISLRVQSGASDEGTLARRLRAGRPQAAGRRGRSPPKTGSTARARRRSAAPAPSRDPKYQTAPPRTRVPAAHARLRLDTLPAQGGRHARRARRGLPRAVLLAGRTAPALARPRQEACPACTACPAAKS